MDDICLGDLESLLVTNGYTPVLGDTEDNFRVFTKIFHGLNDEKWIVTTSVLPLNTEG